MPTVIPADRRRFLQLACAGAAATLLPMRAHAAVHALPALP